MIPEKVLKILKKESLEYFEFPEGSTFTSVDAARMLGVEIGQIAKSILFIGKSGNPYLIVCPGDRKVLPSRLKKVVGEKTRLANAEQTKQFTGFLPGGVCPFGIDNVRIILDITLKDYDTIYPAAGTSGSAVKITFEKLRDITDAEIADLTVPMNN